MRRRGPEVGGRNVLETIAFHLALCLIATCTAAYFRHLIVTEFRYHGLNQYNSTYGAITALHATLAASQLITGLTAVTSAL